MSVHQGADLRWSAAGVDGSAGGGPYTEADGNMPFVRIYWCAIVGAACYRWQMRPA